MDANVPTDISPELLSVIDDIMVAMRDDFDLLNIHMACCRMRLMGTVEFSELSP